MDDVELGYGSVLDGGGFAKFHEFTSRSNQTTLARQLLHIRFTALVFLSWCNVLEHLGIAILSNLGQCRTSRYGGDSLFG